MDIIYAEGLLTGPAGKQATVRFLVDSGAIYTLVLHDVEGSRPGTQTHRHVHVG
ncbi:MAG: hypothetical protein JO189_24190 [Deltaproteobacteria bacterium]|nr:hypothetical protein [Deltaproteobacteria bacterium]